MMDDDDDSNEGVVTHARIKYIDDNSVDIVPIDRIIQFKFKKPKNVTDFDKKKIYKIEFSDEKNPKKIILKILISDLACGEAEVEKINLLRPKFAKINESDLVSTSGVDEENEDLESEIHTATVVKKKKKKIQQQRGKSILTSAEKRQKISHFSDSDSDSESAALSESRYVAELTQENKALKISLQRKDTEIKELFKITKMLQKRIHNTDDNSRNSTMEQSNLQSLCEISYDANNVNNSDQPQPGTSRSNNLPYVYHEHNENNSTLSSNNALDDTFDNEIENSFNDNRAGNDDDGDNEGELYTRQNFLSNFIISSIQYYKERGPGYEERRKRYTLNENNEIYLGEGIYVKSVTWQLLQTEKPNIFVRELAMKIWKPRDLANRALQVKKIKQNIPNRSPIKSVEKPLLRLLISLYNDFLEKQRMLSSDQKAGFLRNVTHVLSQKIRDCRKEEKAALRSKRMRYS